MIINSLFFGGEVVLELGSVLEDTKAKNLKNVNDTVSRKLKI